MSDNFHGVKVALLNKDQILIYLRDDKPGLRFAGLWDLPGGGREGKETPIDTAIREIAEEFGITLSPQQLTFSKAYPSMHLKNVASQFMVGSITDDQISSIKFGSEGQRYKMVRIDEYLQMQGAVTPLQDRLAEYLRSFTPINS